MGVGSVVGSIFVIPWLRSRFCDRPFDADRSNYSRRYLCSHGDGPPLPVLSGSNDVSWRESRSLSTVGGRPTRPPKFGRGRISPLMMVIYQGTITLGAIAWGLSAQIAGTRLTLLAAAFLFCVTAVVLMLLFRISRELSGSPDETKALAKTQAFLIDAC
jgi:hypothetical protein